MKNPNELWGSDNASFVIVREYLRSIRTEQEGKAAFLRRENPGLGEYFDYNSPPDFFLGEVSGIPFGLMGEMLQDGGHPYRGLVYGMTARVYGTTDPRPVTNSTTWEPQAMSSAISALSSSKISHWALIASAKAW